MAWPTTSRATSKATIVREAFKVTTNRKAFKVATDHKAFKVTTDHKAFKVITRCEALTTPGIYPKGAIGHPVSRRRRSALKIAMRVNGNESNDTVDLDRFNAFFKCKRKAAWMPGLSLIKRRGGRKEYQGTTLVDLASKESGVDRNKVKNVQ